MKYVLLPVASITLNKKLLLRHRTEPSRLLRMVSIGTNIALYDAVTMMFVIFIVLATDGGLKNYLKVILTAKLRIA